MMSERMATTAVSMAKANVISSLDAMTTIALRTQALLSADAEPIERAREAQVMVAEKLDAAIEGAVAAQAELAAFLLRATLGGVMTPNDLSLGLASIAEAAARPARRKVRANARRLIGL